jgi:hypothetical protein
MTGVATRRIAPKHTAEPLPETADMANAFALLIEAYDALGTPEGKNVARILSYARMAHFSAMCAPPLQREAKIKAIAKAERAISKILAGKRPPLIAMRRHEVLRTFYEMVKTTLASRSPNRATLLTSVLSSMVRVHMRDLPKAADPRLPELIGKEIRRVEMNSDALALTPASAQLLVKRTLIVGMDKDDAKEATTILRKKEKSPTR